MSNLNFEAIKITTMTVIIELTDEVNIENAFPLLELVRLDLPVQIRQTKKFKIPYCGVPGAILSAKFKNWTRGIVKNKSNKFFRNSITLDICTSRKNISIKLSKKKIQMCGADSPELVVETVEHILTHLKRIQGDIDYMKENLEAKENTINWIKENTRGDLHIIDIDNQEIVLLNEGETIVNLKEPDEPNENTDPNNEPNDPNNEQNNEQNNVQAIVKTDGTYRTKRIEKVFEYWSDQYIVNDDKYIVDKKGVPYKMVNPYTGNKGNSTTVDELIPCILEQNFFIKPNKYDNDGNIISYVFVNTIGKPVVLVTYETLKVCEVYSIKIPEGYPDIYPENVDQRIANMCVRQTMDHVYHHIYAKYIDEICKIETVVPPDIEILKINTAMINYNFSLQMCINRWELATNINGRDGFEARYDNTSDHCVTITLPFEVSDEMKSIRKKNKRRCHTFMVYKSGVVTFSGPNTELMREAFYKFMKTINDIRPMICVKGKPFTLKFNPIPYQKPVEIIDEVNKEVNEEDPEIVNKELSVCV